MSDDEVYDLLLKLSSKRVADWQKGLIRHLPAVDEPASAGTDICETVWYIGTRPIVPDLRSAGASDEQIARALGRRKHTLGIVEVSDLVPIPADLARQIATDLETALAQEPADGWQRLDEKVVDFISEARVEIYFNEGQPRGREHVAVVLQDGKVSVSLEDPPVLLTKNGYRGEASALKVVARHRTALRALWDDTRPDDQKLPSR